MSKEEMRLMKTEEEVRNRAKELLQMPKVEVLAKYMFQEQEIERLNNIINELEKWLEEKQMITGINNQGFSWGVAGDCLDKLKELKENK